MDNFFRSMPRYKVIGKIGEGGFANVYMAHDFSTNLNVAVKRIPFTKKMNGLPSMVLREISVLKELEHENVVRLLDVRITSNDFALVFEYLDYDLHRLMERDSEPLEARLVKGFLFQILQGLSYCHSQKVMHRDLKPRNVLFDRATKTVKLADFGYARTFDVTHDSRYSTEVTTRAYRAPELLLRSPYSSAVDIWSAGCLFAEMVNREPLFDGPSYAVCMTMIIRAFGVPSETEWPGITSQCLKVCQLQKIPYAPTPKLGDLVPGLEPEGLDLLARMLCVVPSRRISAYDALRHPYFKDVDLDLGPIFFRV
ncbi:hypothetical protein C2S53_011126 [Perilla frutescens var. hirtella]|uniref:Protein kinase domain-containing protein n=1 Tax=Perilla frutescens var. hirtella TaxID=608512 RepID=A0AAD4IS63_PERFH|nr:hypothetical protein C2S53_011126 [Perilla frutescens var. hirtella]